MGSRASAEMARAREDEDREEDEALGQEREEGGPGPPKGVFSSVFFLCPLITFLLSGGIWDQETGLP